MVEDLFNRLKKARKWEKPEYIAQNILHLTKKGDKHLVKPTIQVFQIHITDYRISGILRKILDKIGTEVVFEALVDIANDNNDPTAVFAVSRLRDINTPEAYQAIKELFISSQNTKVRAYAYDIITSKSYNIKDHQNFMIDAYKKVLKTELDLDLGKKIIENFIKMSGRKSLVWIIDYLEDSSKSFKNKDLRMAAEEMIKEKRHQKYVRERGWELTSGELIISKLKDGSLNNLNIEGQESTVKRIYIFILENRSDFTSLNGIEKFQNVEKLSLGSYVPTDLSSISRLQKLKTLTIFHDKEFKDTSAIENFPNLRELNLYENGIEEIKGLTNLPRLNSLNLSKNKISKITGLDHLISLERLDLSNNQITDVKGLEKLIYLNYLNLENNPLPKPIGVMKGDDAVRFISNLAGITIEAIAGRSKVVPFHNVVLINNVEDQCLYCKKSISSSQNYQSNCADKLLGMIMSKNSKIPSQVTEKIMVEAGRTTTSVGYKRTSNPYSSFTTYTTTSPSKYEKKKKSTKHLIGKFYTLAGTVCNNCSGKFLSEAKKNLNTVKTRGKAEDIIISVDKVIRKHNYLIRSWIKKADQ